MIITYRFVRLIEDHSDALATSLLHKVQKSIRTESYNHKVPREDLRQRVSEIYRHLGEWLLHKNESDIEQRYTEIGSRRARQGVPLSELIWAIILTKHNLWEFILDEAYRDRPVEVLGKQELLQLLDQFFDRAIHSAAVGYEWATEARSKEEERKAG
jgi:RsbT co-antagonist protein rsbRD N-terminal domain